MSTQKRKPITATELEAEVTRSAACFGIKLPGHELAAVSEQLLEVASKQQQGCPNYKSMEVFLRNFRHDTIDRYLISAYKVALKAPRAFIMDIGIAVGKRMQDHNLVRSSDVMTPAYYQELYMDRLHTARMLPWAEFLDQYPLRRFAEHVLVFKRAVQSNADAQRLHQRAFERKADQMARRYAKLVASAPGVPLLDSKKGELYKLYSGHSLSATHYWRVLFKHFIQYGELSTQWLRDKQPELFPADSATTSAKGAPRAALDVGTGPQAVLPDISHAVPTEQTSGATAAPQQGVPCQNMQMLRQLLTQVARGDTPPGIVLIRDIPNDSGAAVEISTASLLKQLTERLAIEHHCSVSALASKCQDQLRAVVEQRVAQIAAAANRAFQHLVQELL